MTGQATTLAEILAGLKSLPWDHAIFLAGKAPYALATTATVLDPDDSNDAEADPQLAQSNGMHYVISVHLAQSILENLRQQKQDATLVDLVEAFNHYLAYDAFMSWTRG